MNYDKQEESVYWEGGLRLPSGRILRAVWQRFDRKIAEPSEPGCWIYGRQFVSEGILFRLFWKWTD